MTHFMAQVMVNMKNAGRHPEKEPWHVLLLTWVATTLYLVTLVALLIQ